MKPPSIRYFFSSIFSFTFILSMWIVCIAIPLFLVIAMWRTYADYLDPFSSLWDSVRFCWNVGIALLLGLLISLLTLSFFAAPFCLIITAINGGPFKIGDTVLILSGPHKGRVSQIYSEWGHNEFRVDLGPGERKSVTDHFSALELMRVKKPEANTK